MMNFVYVKDSEGYVFKKPSSEVAFDEQIISEKVYLNESGLAAFFHGCTLRKKRKGLKRFA